MKHAGRLRGVSRSRLHAKMAPFAFVAGLILAAPALAGCDAAAKVEGPSSVPPLPARELDYAQLWVETDLRRHDAALALGLLNGDVDHRVAAARGLGLIGSEGALSLLQRGLSDADAAVRAEVSFGLGLAGLPLDAWLGAYAVERDPAVRRLMTQDLGRALDLTRAGPLLRALDGPETGDACVGINHMLRRDPELPPEHVRRLQRLASDPDPATALHCLRALAAVARASLAPVSEAVLAQVEVGLRHESSEVRLAWLQMLPALAPLGTPLLATASDDPDATVASRAIEQLARRGLGQLDAVSAAFDRRLSRALTGKGGSGDPAVLHAALDAAPAMGRSAEVANWLATVVDRLASAAPGVEDGDVPALRCAAARALDRVKEWPSRSVGCGGAERPAWVGQVAAVEVMASAKNSDALRAAQLRRLFDEGDWHVKRASMAGVAGLPPESARAFVLDGLSSDHPEIRTAATLATSHLLPRLPRTASTLPTEFVAPLRAAFQAFHVTQHVPGLRAWLAVARNARLRGELGGVTVLARSSITPVREDARALLAEWGHPVPSESPEPVRDPVAREQLSLSRTRLTLRLPTGEVTVVLDPAHAPVTVARLIQWVGTLRPPLEVSDWAPAQYVLLSDAAGATSTAWRSEESRQPLLRGTVVVPQHGRDGVSAALLILLAPAPELAGRVSVVGQVSPDGMAALDRLAFGDSVHAEVGETP